MLTPWGDGYPGLDGVGEDLGPFVFAAFPRHAGQCAAARGPMTRAAGQRSPMVAIRWSMPVRESATRAVPIPKIAYAEIGTRSSHSRQDPALPRTGKAR
ncbi:hypothetical protein GCM10011512_12830 [Tersicoccus solisilvae]|uniref:Uncharacterized protein n=1 Tax=Tersicoccus solisilvae TaxID=1882339 RepID=A0ABQ1NYU3_9MICC|nr:hypothetical protein GCM10011512_12830 [Tersicoccus solisilvae]